MEHGIGAAASHLPAAPGDWVAMLEYHITWFVMRVTLLTLIAASVVVLLVRRAGQPTEA